MSASFPRDKSSAVDPVEQPPTVLFGGESSASELVRLLEGYLADLEAGRAPDRREFIAAHPAWAAQLEQCLGGIEFMHRAGGANAGMPAQLGDFRIVREVGRGGMGVVYEAEQLSLKRKVALKVLRFGAVADAEAMQRFQREAETVAGLHHTNIVPIFAIGCEQEVRYYAMQFIEGRSLAQVCIEGAGTGERFAPHDVAGWALQAAEALAHAHARGVVHRDVKPSNLILDGEGRIWLTDFGLAKRDDDVTLSIAGALLGTPRYMSPEQASGLQKPVDHRSDIYSLGATLYELATGRPIFNADTPHGVISQILSQEPQRPRLFAPKLSQDLETIILKCLEKEPSRRYATAADLAGDLRAFLEDRPIAARRATTLEQALRWIHKHRRTVTTATISAVAVLLLVIVALGSWQAYRHSQNGMIRIASDGKRLVAEVLDNQDQPVLAPFPVPTDRPVTLPAGEYRLRVSSSGLLSETWPLTVERRQSSMTNVQLAPRWLWRPRDIDGADRPVLLNIGRRTDILFSLARYGEGANSNGPALRRLNGSTGLPAWPRDFVFDRTAPPAGLTDYEWVNVPSFAIDGLPPHGLVEPAPDVNEDGEPDVVFQSHTVAMIVALSGKDGALLWWHRGKPPGETGAPPPPFNNVGSRFGLGWPAMTQVDGDGVPDLVACFVSANPNDFQAPQQAWVGAVSGKDGTFLWSHDLGPGKYAESNYGLNAKAGESPCRPVLISRGDTSEIVVAAGRRLVRLNSQTGERLDPPIELPADTLHAPQALHQDGDGIVDALLVTLRGEKSNDSNLSEIFHLQAVPLKPGAALRQHAFRLGRDAQEWTQWPEGLFIVDDLDGDRSTEVLLYEVQPDPQHWRRTTFVKALDGATLQARWEHALLRESMNGQSAAGRLIVGPDLDGDGTCEVFVAAFVLDPATSGRSFAVTALAGADGRMLWRKSVPFSAWQSSTDPVGALAWWNTGPDGWPLLMVPVAYGPGGQPITYFVSAADGRILHTLPEVSALSPADFNGDGLLDLFYTVSPQGAPRMIVLEGSAPETWKRLGNWRAIQDVDRDGADDFVSRSGSVASGADARILWRADSEHWDGSQRDLVLAPPLPAGDFDGDGVPDLIGPDTFRRETGTNSWGTIHTISAISGRDGRRIWAAAGLSAGGGASGGGTGWKYEHPSLGWADLDGDQRAEILVAHGVSGRQSMVLSAVSGRDGALLWQMPMVYGAYGVTPDLYGPPRHDLDGDGTADLVLWTPVGDGGSFNAPCELSAFSGKDRRPLWTYETPGSFADTDRVWPIPAVDDLDGDGVPEVVTARRISHDPNRGHESELVVLDGKTGAAKGRWSWWGDHNALPPLLVDFEGTGRRTICLGINEAWGHSQGGAAVVALDAVGMVLRRAPLNVPSGALGQETGLWRKFDLDGDGREELLYPHDGRLIASRGSGEPLWSWPLPDNATEIVDIRAEGDEPHSPATVVVWAGKAVMGLSGTNGRAIWKCDVPMGPIRGTSSAPTVELTRGKSPSGPPVVVFRAESIMEHLHATVGRQALPLDREGRYAPTAPAPLALRSLPENEAEGVKLPWLASGPGPIESLLVTVAVPSGVLTLVIAVIPAWLALAAYRRRSWGLALLLLAYVSVGLSEVIQRGLIGLAVFPPTGIERLGSNLTFVQGASGVFALLLPALLLRDAMKHRDARPALAAVVFLCLMAAPFVYSHLTTEHPLAEVHHWGRWWWLDELVGEPCMVVLACTPGAVFWWKLWQNLRQRRPGRVALLLVAATFAGAVAAAIFLAIDSRYLVPGDRYSPRGWWTAWFIGAYAIGAVLLLVMLGRSIAAWWRRFQLRRSASQ